MCCKDEYFFLINQAIDGELEGEALQQLEAHLAQCPQCRQMDAALRRMAAESAGLEQAAPAELTEKIMAQVQKARRITPRPARIMRWVVSLSGAAAVLIMGFFALRLGFTRAGSMAAGNCAPMAAPPEAVKSGEAMDDWEDAIIENGAAPGDAPAEGRITASSGAVPAVRNGRIPPSWQIIAWTRRPGATCWCWMRRRRPWRTPPIPWRRTAAAATRWKMTRPWRCWTRAAVTCAWITGPASPWSSWKKRKKIRPGPGQ